MKKLLLLAFLASFLSFSQTQRGSTLNGEFAGDLFGFSVSLNSNGSIMAIGATDNDNNGLDSGHTRVFQYNNTNWIQIGSDIEGVNGDRSGSPVYLNSDGSILAVSYSWSNVYGQRTGHVRVFEYNDTDWVQIGSDIIGESTNNFLASSMSFNEDGTILALGSTQNDGNGPDSGHVRIFEYNNTDWVQIGSDIDGEANDDASGKSVSLSSDGTIVAIGAWANDDNGMTSGHVRVFEYNGTDWVQIGSDIDGEAAFDQFGVSNSLSSNGTILAIGGNLNNGNGANSGHVRVFQYNGIDWIQIGSDIDGEASFDSSGTDVELSSDGTILVVNARENDGNGLDSGHVRIFRYNNTDWDQVGVDINGDAEGDAFGHSISLSSDGNILAVGAPFNDGNGNNSGQAKVYDLSSVLSTERNDILQFSLYPNPTKDQFTIQLQEGIELKKVSIYNQLGQFIFSSQDKNVDTSSLSQGLYFVKALTDKGTSTKKLIID